MCQTLRMIHSIGSWGFVTTLHIIFGYFWLNHPAHIVINCVLVFLGGKRLANDVSRKWQKSDNNNNNGTEKMRLKDSINDDINLTYFCMSFSHFYDIETILCVCVCVYQWLNGWLAGSWTLAWREHCHWMGYLFCHFLSFHVINIVIKMPRNEMKQSKQSQGGSIKRHSFDTSVGARSVIWKPRTTAAPAF